MGTAHSVKVPLGWPPTADVVDRHRWARVSGSLAPVTVYYDDPYKHVRRKVMPLPIGHISPMFGRHFDCGRSLSLANLRKLRELSLVLAVSDVNAFKPGALSRTQNKITFTK